MLSNWSTYFFIKSTCLVRNDGVCLESNFHLFLFIFFRNQSIAFLSYFVRGAILEKSNQRCWPTNGSCEFRRPKSVFRKWFPSILIFDLSKHWFFIAIRAPLFFLFLYAYMKSYVWRTVIIVAVGIVNGFGTVWKTLWTAVSGELHRFCCAIFDETGKRRSWPESRNRLKSMIELGFQLWNHSKASHAWPRLQLWKLPEVDSKVELEVWTLRSWFLGRTTVSMEVKNTVRFPSFTWHQLFFRNISDPNFVDCRSISSTTEAWELSSLAHKLLVFMSTSRTNWFFANI